jgi:type IV fimbrial biogenesis protein FimT
LKSAINIIMKKENEWGLTLIELVITIAVASILVGLAVPSFRDMIQANRMASHANEMVSSLNLARSEAIKRSVQVRMSATTPGATNEWGKGWTVWVDLDDDGVIDTAATDEEILRKVDSFSSGLTFDSTSSTDCTGNKSEYTYNPDGSMGACEIIQLCDGSQTGEKGREVNISPSGRVSVSDYTCS